MPAVLQDYRIKQVIGDNYAAEWVTAHLQGCGHQVRALGTSQVPTVSRSVATVHARTDRDPRPTTAAERTATARTPDPSIRQGHGRSRQERQSDDLANALCGCAAHVMKQGSYRSDLDWMHGPSSEVKESTMTFDTEWRRRLVRPIRRLGRLHQTLLNRSAIMAQQVQKI